MHAGVREKPARQLTVLAPVERAVEIDEVDPASARARELLRHGEGVVGIRGRAARVALPQTHHAPALDINGGIELHSRKKTKGS